MMKPREKIGLERAGGGGGGAVRPKSSVLNMRSLRWLWIIQAEMSGEDLSAQSCGSGETSRLEM